MENIKCLRCGVDMEETNISSKFKTTTGTATPYRGTPYHMSNYEAHSLLIEHEKDVPYIYDPIEDYETVCARKCPKCGMIELYSKVRRKNNEQK